MPTLNRVIFYSGNIYAKPLILAEYIPLNNPRMNNSIMKYIYPYLLVSIRAYSGNIIYIRPITINDNFIR